MNRRGLIGMIILGVLAFLIIVGIGAGIYFYNFHVFKEIRICVGEWEDIGLPCEDREYCLEMLNVSSEAVEGAPSFVVENFDDILESAVYCEGNCYVGQIRGLNYESGEIEGLESCGELEDEFVMEIRGEEGLDILSWMKNQN